MPSPLRMKRINERFKEVLSETLLSQTDDPRLNGVMITDVKVDRELDYANVYVSSLGGREQAREAIEGLNHARGFLKYALSSQIDLRLMPKLRFFWDPTPENASRIDDLIAHLQDDTPAVSEAPAGAPDDNPDQLVEPLDHADEDEVSADDAG